MTSLRNELNASLPPPPPPTMPHFINCFSHAFVITTYFMERRLVEIRDDSSISLGADEANLKHCSQNKS